MSDVEPQMAEWRAYVAKAPAINGRDLDELEVHLRDQIAELDEAGLTADEAFLIAVKRMGDLDSLSREFAREHSGRLWKQLLLSDDEEVTRPASGWVEAFIFALAAAVPIQVAVRIAGQSPEVEPRWLLRNVSLLVFPFLAIYLARIRHLDTRRTVLTVAPFVFLALVVNLYPFETNSVTELIVALHLPVAAWCAIAYPYMGGTLGTHERRMDFVRFTGEWVIYYVLIALGGGVLLGLTALIVEPIRANLGEEVIEWVLPSGAAGAVIVAGWLVGSKQHVVENMAPVLTMIFTPLFAVMLAVAAATYAITGGAGAFDRELLGVFDALLVVVLGLVLYSMSAREPSQSAGMMDRVQLLAVASALLLDAMVLVAMVARISDLGFTPNRAVALGLNLILLVNLAGAAWLSIRFLRGQITFHRLERWQTSYLPIFGLWVAAVLVILPPLFAFA